MNNPSPLVPQGILDQKNSSRSRVKLAFFCIVGVHVVGLMVLLMQGCKREPEQTEPTLDPNTFLMETNFPTLDAVSNVAPSMVETNTALSPSIVDPTLVMPAPAAPAQQEYIIQSGDTFSSIGTKFHVPWMAIRDANPNVNPNKLQIGKKIVIPAVTSAPGGTASGSVVPGPTGIGEQTYTVKSGDTLTKIASQQETTVKALRAANNLKTDRIRVGDKLIIPPKVAPPAPAESTTIPVAPPAVPQGQ